MSCLRVPHREGAEERKRVRDLQRWRSPLGGFCPEKNRLSEAFLDAVHELLTLQTQQTQAVIAGDEDFARFDILMHIAQENKERAKYEWIAHVEKHRCDEEGKTDEPRSRGK